MTPTELLDKLEAGAEEARGTVCTMGAHCGPESEYMCYLFNNGQALLRVVRAAWDFHNLCLEYTNDETDAPEYGCIAVEICSAVEELDTDNCPLTMDLPTTRDPSTIRSRAVGMLRALLQGRRGET